MIYLLDTSAPLAFYFDEPGGERVRDILNDDQATVQLSVLGAAEFWSRLRSVGQARRFDEEWRQFSEIVAGFDPVTLEVVRRAIDLRAAATARLPQIDALIAATAARAAAVLVHRDPHFLSIPTPMLKQEAACQVTPIMTITHKKLIEVALPLDAINKASAREKSIRHGHPSTLHLWWARRPLAAARAVIFAQMVDSAPPSAWAMTSSTPQPASSLRAYPR